jgi:nucleoside-diphosphate-sugar epimerase
VSEHRAGVLGASSLVGRYLLPLLTLHGWNVTAFSRSIHRAEDSQVRWFKLSQEGLETIPDSPIPAWICAAPIWVLPQYFKLLEDHGARVVVALSSTSSETKISSPDTAEKVIADHLLQGEARFRQWAEEQGVRWVILRPTLIYGGGQDKNIAEIARIIRRFGFFPLVGMGTGLRQPVHAEDVAKVCVSALCGSPSQSAVYHLSGGETLRYRDMIGRVFEAMGRRPCMPVLPLWVFKIVLSFIRWLPRYQHWSIAMALRMNKDQVFDCTAAVHDLGFMPRPFFIEKKDLPK